MLLMRQIDAIRLKCICIYILRMILWKWITFQKKRSNIRASNETLSCSRFRISMCTLVDRRKKKRQQTQLDIKCGRPSEKLLLRPVITLASIDFMLIATQIPHMQHLFLRLHLRLARASTCIIDVQVLDAWFQTDWRKAIVRRWFS